MPEAVAIVVPTRDRPEALARCLAALAAQTAVTLDVVVVDDGSADQVRVAAIVAADRNARLVRTDGAGAAAARNAGAQATSGAVVLFTDDDCVPERRWVETLAAAIRAEPDAITGGVTVPLAGSPATVRATEVITRVLTSRTRFRATNNVGTSRELLLTFPFDERFRGAAGEDRDWCARLDEAGVAMRTATDAIVVHAPEAGLARFWRRHVRYGRAARTLRRSGGRQPLSFYAALVEEGFREGLDVGLLVLTAQIATAFGFMAGPRRPGSVSS